ncbi:MAG: BrnT family toxin [Patescibacteria group bacterium]
MFEWDEKKNECNIQKHGIDFKYILSIFDDKHQTIIIDNRKDYGEIREIIFGIVETQQKYIFCVVFTRSLKAIRIISARVASKEETSLYYANY